jgi:hypothetical protein
MDYGADVLMKPNFRQIRRRERSVVPMEFKNDQLEAPITIWLGKLGTFAMDGVQEIADERTAQYVTGNFVDSHGQFIKEPMVILTAQGDPVRLNPRSIYSLCVVERMQIGAPEGVDVYTFEDLVNLGAFFPDVWDEVKRAATRIQYGDEKKEEGNDSGG